MHDIGKITGTSSPTASVEILKKYEIREERLLNLVKYHDVNLPWYNSLMKGETPSDKAWRKLNNKVDLRLLCIFMIADRVDAPDGWRSNQPLVWFLHESKKRSLINPPIILEDNELA